jgi:hypothetical protein
VLLRKIRCTALRYKKRGGGLTKEKESKFQRFLFLLALLLEWAPASTFVSEEDDLDPTAELHKASSTSEAVKHSPSPLNSWYIGKRNNKSE